MIDDLHTILTVLQLHMPIVRIANGFMGPYPQLKGPLNWWIVC